MLAQKRKEPEPPEGQTDPTHVLQIKPLGAGQEVGRSCIIVKYLGKTIMLDCGIHPGFANEASLPYLDDIDLDEVDVMLVTHFHLDHSAAVPFVVGRTPFKGRILMTHPTKAIIGTLLKDFVKISSGRAQQVQLMQGLYSDKDLAKALELTEVIDFHQTLDIDGIKITAYRAGHVLGACMFMIEIAGARVLYTGDYSRLADRHLSPADLPEVQPDVVIVESTYGVSSHSPREEREALFITQVKRVLLRGGRLLLPVVALGRAQELLLILEECWASDPLLHGVPIYQASGLARRAMTIYQTYIEMMNEDIQAAFQSHNPFIFKHVTHLKSMQHLEDTGPCVVMATPSMLQSGLSRDVFEAWCQDPRNGVIIADFAVQGTLAKELISQPKEVLLRNGQKVPLKMSVDAISFSAHADFPQTSEFLDLLKPPHVVLVHGEAGEMMRLKKALEQRAKAIDIERTLHTPKNTEAITILKRPQHLARVVGRLAARRPSAQRPLRGLLVRTGHQDLVVHPDDLPLYTKLQPGRIVQRQHIVLHKPFAEVRLALELMFEGTQGTGDLAQVTGTTGEILRIGTAVTITYQAKTEQQPRPCVILEWEGGPMNDMIADAVIAVILQSSGEPHNLAQQEAARRDALAAQDPAVVRRQEMYIIATLLNSQFGPARVDEEQGLVLLEVDSQHVIVDPRTRSVQCSNEPLRLRVDRALQRLQDAMRPIPISTET
eukprot:jgi/Astpho2/3167/fgenesh1_pm.00052_%23_3_t